MKVPLICYAVRCYLALYDFLKQVPPRGCLSEIEECYRKELPVLKVIERVVDKAKSSKGIVSRNSSINIKDCKISGFGTAIDMDSSSQLDLDGMSVNNCATGINVEVDEDIVMPLNMKNSNFKDVGTVARAPERMLIEVDNCEFEKIKIGFDFYIPPEDLGQIGLPQDTPQELLLEVAKLIRENKEKDEVSLIELISNSELVKWLNVTSGLVTVGTPILSNLLTYFS